MRKVFSLLLCCALCAALLCGCGGSKAGGGSDIRRKNYSSDELQFRKPADDTPVAVFDTTAGKIVAVLYPEQAPMACENFTALAQDGFYNGTAFHRADYGFCLQGGLNEAGGSTTKWNGSGYPAEVTDQLHHYSGALCAAMNADGEGGSVFYFMQTLPQPPADELVQMMTDAGWRTEVLDTYQAVGGAPYLDYTDTVFGQVIEGMDVVDDITYTQSAAEAAAASGSESAEEHPASFTINSVTITTYGEL